MGGKGGLQHCTGQWPGDVRSRVRTCQLQDGTWPGCEPGGGGVLTRGLCGERDGWEWRTEELLFLSWVWLALGAAACAEASEAHTYSVSVPWGRTKLPYMGSERRGPPSEGDRNT